MAHVHTAPRSHCHKVPHFTVEHEAGHAQGGSAVTVASLTHLANLQTSQEVAAHYGSLKGKVFLVTGSSSGIGQECARSLAANGGTVVMACRGGSKAEAAAKYVREAALQEDCVHLLELDLGKQSSIEACAKAFVDLELPLHGLINNACINGVVQWGQFTPGVETQFATNFLGHFHLTNLLDEKLRSTSGARVVNISSESHWRVRSSCSYSFDMDKELPPPPERYDMFHAYAFSNLCRILWTRELARRAPYPVVCVHPGLSGSDTSMLQHMRKRDKIRQVYLFLAWEFRPWNRMKGTKWAARTQTWAAVAPVEDIDAMTGKYFSGNTDCSLGVPVEPSDLALRDDLAIQVYNYADKYFKMSKFVD